MSNKVIFNFVHAKCINNENLLLLTSLNSLNLLFFSTLGARIWYNYK